MSNKKILNAREIEYNNIKFKSSLEVSIYKTLLQEGFEPKYEEQTFTLWEGFKPKIPFYTKDLKTKKLSLNQRAIKSITYTPDFIVEYNGYTIIIEAKGFPNDVFPYKWKMFRKLFENSDKKFIFAIIYTKTQLLEFIKIIKELNETSQITVSKD